LFGLLNKSNQPIPPLVFLQVLRTAFPQFAQKGEGGIFMQQDAEECWSQIVHSLNQKMPKLEAPPSNTVAAAPFDPASKITSSIGQLFAGEFSYT
jgi:ubiquitin carboxyl-terminal hydrolase 14